MRRDLSQMTCLVVASLTSCLDGATCSSVLDLVIVFIVVIMQDDVGIDNKLSVYVLIHASFVLLSYSAINAFAILFEY